ncbi:MAG: hypothetical protein AAF558_07600 [Verrucomicrobiota bacterium]
MAFFLKCLKLKSVATVVGLFLIVSSQGNALVLDWNNVAWNSGDLTNSYDVDGDSVNDITITVSPDFTTNSPPTGAFTNLSSSGQFSPVRDAVFTGGGGANNQNLYLGVDFGNRNQLITVTVAFTQTVTDVSFTLFDVDFNFGQFRDIISLASATDGITNFTGNFTTGTSHQVAPFNLGGQPFVFGNGGSANTSSAGNLGIDFGTDQINSFSFNYSSTPTFIGDGGTPTNPGVQGIGLHDINFTVVPEVEGFVAVALMCGLIFGNMLRRRLLMRDDAF